MAIATKHPSTKLVLLCLAYHHNGKTERCDPTVKTLVTETGLSNVTVMTALDTLEALTLLAKKPGHGRSHNAYILNIHNVNSLDLLKVNLSDLETVQSQATSPYTDVQSQTVEIQSQTDEISKSSGLNSKSSGLRPFNIGTGNNRNITGIEQEDYNIDNAFTKLGKANGTYSSLQAEQLGELIDSYGDDTVAAAIAAATKANSGRRLSINFIDAIAKHFAEHGIGCDCKTKKGKERVAASPSGADKYFEGHYGQILKQRQEAKEGSP